jgi:hypothetical protein
VEIGRKDLENKQIIIIIIIIITYKQGIILCHRRYYEGCSSETRSGIVLGEGVVVRTFPIAVDGGIPPADQPMDPIRKNLWDAA